VLRVEDVSDADVAVHCFTRDREDLDLQVLSGLALVVPLAEFIELGADLIVRERADVGFEGGDAIHAGGVSLDGSFVGVAEELLEDGPDDGDVCAAGHGVCSVFAGRDRRRDRGRCCPTGLWVGGAVG